MNRITLTLKRPFYLVEPFFAIVAAMGDIRLLLSI